MKLHLQRFSAAGRAGLWLAAALGAGAAQAQNTTTWTTNFYNVTGASFREIRESMARSRPWKDDFDGDTRWDIRWSFRYAARAGGCAVSSHSVTTKIVTTMPRWTPPTNVDPAVKEQWTRFYTSLWQHEAGHGSIGMVAAAEVNKKLAEVPAQPECEALARKVDEAANRVLSDYKAREKEYDRRTDHGRNPR